MTPRASYAPPLQRDRLALAARRRLAHAGLVAATCLMALILAHVCLTGARILAHDLATAEQLRGW